MPENIQALVGVREDEVDGAAVLDGRAQADDFSLEPGQHRFLFEVEQSDGLFEGGTPLHDECRPVDNDFNRF